jgi:hypothetical protein
MKKVRPPREENFGETERLGRRKACARKGLTTKTTKKERRMRPKEAAKTAHHTAAAAATPDLEIAFPSLYPLHLKLPASGPSGERKRRTHLAGCYQARRTNGGASSKGGVD